MFSKNQKRQRVPWLPNQNGVALMLTMLILAASAVIGLSFAVQNTIESRVAANQKSTETAFRNAETGMEYANLLLAGRFKTAPQNLAKIRDKIPGGPDWEFLFYGLDDMSCAACCSNQNCDQNGFKESYCGQGCYPNSGSQPLTTSWKETLVSESSDYKVYASNYGNDLKVITLRSVGFGPRGAKQVLEVRVIAKNAGSQIGYYAQEGAGPTKTNTNIHDMNKVSGGQVTTNIGTIH